MDKTLCGKFRMDAAYDIALLPYSPVMERDTLEIRCQVFNEGGDDTLELVFKLDGDVMHTEPLFVKGGTYGFARCRIPMCGRAGTHTVSVNGVCVPLEVRPDAPAVLDGGFVMLGPPNDRKALQFTPALKSFTDADWKAYVRAMAAAGMDCLIVMSTHQYVEYQTPDRALHAHFDSARFPRTDIAAKDPIAAILEEAEVQNIKVFLGIGCAYGNRGSAEEVDEVYARYCGYRAFYGWYQAKECNMQHFDIGEWGFLEVLAQRMRSHAPVKPILNSPYEMPGPEIVDYIRRIDFCDILMPQDWVGQKRLNLQQSGEMLRILKDTYEAVGKHVWANCEAFNFTEAQSVNAETGTNFMVPRFRDGGMDGEEGFIQQMETVRPYAEKIMAFMLTGLFLPQDFTPPAGGPPAEKQFREYTEYAAKARKNG